MVTFLRFFLAAELNECGVEVFLTPDSTEHTDECLVLISEFREISGYPLL